MEEAAGNAGRFLLSPRKVSEASKSRSLLLRAFLLRSLLRLLCTLLRCFLLGHRNSPYRANPVTVSPLAHRADRSASTSHETRIAYGMSTVTSRRCRLLCLRRVVELRIEELNFTRRHVASRRQATNASHPTNFENLCKPFTSRFARSRSPQVATALCSPPRDGADRPT